MSDFQRLSVRRGLRPIPSLAEGVPPHLQAHLRYWLEGVFGYRSRQGGMRDSLMMSVALAAAVPLSGRASRADLMMEILSACARDEDTYLDVVDAALAKGAPSAGLAAALKDGNSVWTVREDQRGLERRVEESAAESFKLAATPEDSASSELREAWVSVFSIAPNPSDGWDHAIKAVEDVLIPIIVPNKTKASLADVAGILKSSPGSWILDIGAVANPDRAVETLEGMLRLMWPNPDRHGGAIRRAPTNSEAAAILHLAVVIVQWAREGKIKPRTS